MKIHIHIVVLCVVISACVAQQSNKPGSCPKPQSGSLGTCVFKCKSDKQCSGSQKCCSNGCGHVCMKPESDTNVGNDPCATMKCGPKANCTVTNGKARCILHGGNNHSLSCRYNGKTYRSNTTFRSTTGCVCNCRRGKVICTKLRCNSNTTMPRGCTYNGVQYPNNSTFPAKDGCNKCRCRNGHVNCTTRICSGGCRYFRKVYPNNSTFKDIYGCTCRCRAGSISCKRTPSCAPKRPKNCTYNGHVYRHNSTFKSTDGCNTCRCNNGTVRCTRKACPTGGTNPCQNHRCRSPAVCRAVNNHAVCGCLDPSTQQFYQQGHGFKNPNGCGTCSCYGGKVRCRQQTCPTQQTNTTRPPNPCLTKKCPNGTQCHLQRVQCVRAPCYPIAVCLNTTKPTLVSPTCPPFHCHRNCSAGYVRDKNGCQHCQCHTPPSVTCSPVRCLIFCINGYETDKNGCDICKCKPAPTNSPTCPSVRCRIFCPYGYVKDTNGCDICQCIWPTRAPTSAVVKPHVTCSPVQCLIYCRYGFAEDSNGCAVCRCNPSPSCAPVTCNIYCKYGFMTNSNGCPVCACKHGPTHMTTTMGSTAMRPTAPTPTPACQVFCTKACPGGYIIDSNGCPVKNCSCVSTATPTDMSGCNISRFEDCFSDPDISSDCNAAQQALDCYRQAILPTPYDCPDLSGIDTQADGVRQAINRLCRVPTSKTTTMAPTTPTPFFACRVFCTNACPEGYVTDFNGCPVESCSCVATAIPTDMSGCNVSMFEDCFSDPNIGSNCNAARQAHACYEQAILSTVNCPDLSGIDTQADGVRQAITKLCRGLKCSYGGSTYPDAASFPSADGCNSCTCQGTEVLCETEYCTSPLFCAYGGAKKETGDTFTALDGCNTCKCSEGFVTCTTTICETTHYLRASVEFDVNYNQLLPDDGSKLAFTRDFSDQIARLLFISPAQIHVISVVSGSVVVTFAVQTRNLTVVEKQIEELLHGNRFTITFNAIMVTADRETFSHEEMLGALPSSNAANTKPKPSGSDSNVDVKLIAGAATGGFIVAVILALIIAYVLHRKRSSNDDSTGFARFGSDIDEINISNPSYRPSRDDDM